MAGGEDEDPLHDHPPAPAVCDVRDVWRLLGKRSGRYLVAHCGGRSLHNLVSGLIHPCILIFVDTAVHTDVLFASPLAVGDTNFRSMPCAPS